VLSDPHINRDGYNEWLMGKDSISCLQRTVEALNSEVLDFILILGDLLNNGEVHNLVSAKKILDTLTAPYFIIAGNHDYCPPNPAVRRAGYQYISIDDFINTFRGHGYGESGNRCWARQLAPGLRLIGLDGCLVDKKMNLGGHLALEHLKWMERQLEMHKDHFHIIMLHHNLVHWGRDGLSPSGRLYSLDNSREVRALFEAYADSVGVVFSGHRHIGLRRKRVGDIDYFVIPSINSYPMRYGLFELSSRKIQWKTPNVPMDEKLHHQARAGLINAPWISSHYKIDARELISFYENNQQRSGFSQW